MSSKISVPKFNLSGEKLANFEAEVNWPTVNPDLLAQAAQVYLANQREGNGNTKDKGDVSGGGRKPWKQKGTGRARQGSTRSPHFRHGGIAHGPHTAEHRQKFPTSMAKTALKMAFNDKLMGQSLIVLDTTTAEKMLKSKLMSNVFLRLVPTGSLTLILDAASSSVLRASRNLALVKAISAANLTAYDIIAASVVVIDNEAATKVFK